MVITAIEGVVESGKIRLQEEVTLAENTKVYVILANTPTNILAHLHTPRLADPQRSGDFRKQIVEIATMPAYDKSNFDPPAPVSTSPTKT